MPRQLRLQYPGAVYHVMSRGNRRAKIFLDDVDRQDFLKTLAAAGRERCEQWMERRRQEETDPEAQKALRRGWCLGSSGFKRQMLLQMEGELGEHHAGARAGAGLTPSRHIAAVWPCAPGPGSPGS